MTSRTHSFLQRAVALTLSCCLLGTSGGVAEAALGRPSVKIQSTPHLVFEEQALTNAVSSMLTGFSRAAHVFTVRALKVFESIGFNAKHPINDEIVSWIDQGTIVPMIENYRTGMLWNLFMNAPEIQTGLTGLGFHSTQHGF